MGAAAIAGLVLSTIGVGLIWSTFRETRKTTQAAKDSANAAMEAAKVAREIGEAQIGAFLWPTEHGMWMANPKYVLGLSAKLTNYGPTAALDIHMGGEIEVWHSGQFYRRTTFPLQSMLSMGGFDTDTAGPSGTTGLHACVVHPKIMDTVEPNEDEVARLINEDTFFLVTFNFSYRNIFGTENFLTTRTKVVVNERRRVNDSGRPIIDYGYPWTKTQHATGGRQPNVMPAWPENNVT